jgi:hypothetical protein
VIFAFRQKRVCGRRCDTGFLNGGLVSNSRLSISGHLVDEDMVYRRGCVQERSTATTSLSQRWPFIVPRSEVATQPQPSSFDDTHSRNTDNDNHKDNAHRIVGKNQAFLPQPSHTFSKMSQLFTELIAPNGRAWSQPTGLFINNEFVESQKGNKLVTIDPAYVHFMVQKMMWHYSG